MMPRKDMTRAEVGSLKVLRAAGYSNKWGCAMWICRCACGRELAVSGSSLRKPSGVRSCGCARWRRA